MQILNATQVMTIIALARLAENKEKGAELPFLEYLTALFVPNDRQEAKRARFEKLVAEAEPELTAKTLHAVQAIAEAFERADAKKDVQ